MRLTLKCPNCSNTMKYESRTNTPSQKRKQCVYCGRSFKVGGAIRKKA